MTDMIENCCFASPSQTEPDTQTITRCALLAVLPMVLEQELSPRQRTCLRAFYVDGKSQTEIARKGVAEAGGFGARYFCTDICDGESQGTDGINYSLASREMIANICERPGRYRRQHLKSAPAHGAPQKRTAHLSSSYEVRYILCVILCIHQNGD